MGVSENVPVAEQIALQNAEAPHVDRHASRRDRA